ncbi:MAG: RagB/SusD family nutrient uptake outer membrane protein [Bacteroidota bacterium]
MGNLLSCNVLEQEPQQSITPGLAFTNESGARAALNGMYSRMQQDGYYGSDVLYAPDSYTDISIYSGFIIAFLETDNKQVPTSNALVEDIWLDVYDVINVANEIIANVPNMNDENFTQEERDDVLGQARFVRGLSYLNLLTLFGEHDDTSSAFGLPLVTQSTGGDFANVENISRSSVQATYDQIIADLVEAERLLPDSDRDYNAQKAAAQAILAKTYLFLGDYANALAKATEVINNPSFGLNPSYTDIFFSESTEESILELEFNSLDGSNLALYTIRRDEMRPDPALVASFDPADVRRSLIAPVDGFVGERFIKAEDFATDANPAYIIRMAEVYLISAEAKFFQGDETGALADLNAVHTRAGLTAYADASDFVNKLADEYKWEFFAEGQRLGAITRLGLFEEIMGIESFRRIFPLPLREFNIAGNQLTQNPGY